MRKRTLVIYMTSLLVCLAVLFSVAAYATNVPKDAKFVGTKACRSCHLKAHKTWRKTKHAKTFEILEGPETTNPDCLKCHTTGYGKPGGFVSAEETPALKGTGCESCHGPGSRHVDAAKAAPETGAWDTGINRVPLNACIECHNPHVSQKARALKLRAARKAEAS